ncbi:copine [Anaeramoeba flamelloides]|uniref:Copine n=1 Tax=Anaeramoeba flamelloides TaxID=1746091 RepID=A0AAV8AH49_9EUKA|nr:copine [Anaeramoeba flamelloides]
MFPKKAACIFLSCKGLHHPKIGKMDSFLVLYDSEEKELGRTKFVRNDLTPSYETQFVLPIESESKSYTLKLYNMRIIKEKVNNCDLNIHTYIGETSFSMEDLLDEKTNENHRLQLKLIGKEENKDLGWVNVVGIIMKDPTEFLCLKMTGLNLENTETFGKSNPFCVIWRQFKGDEEWYPIAKTEIVYSDLNPEYRTLFIPTYKFCQDDENAPIKIQCFSRNKIKNPYLIGECETSYYKLNSTTRSIVELIDPKKKDKKKYRNSGILEIINVKITNLPTLPQIIENGLKLNVIAAIDFSKVNGSYKGKIFGHSLHDKKEDKNQYRNAIKHSLDKFVPFLGDDPIYAYGYGGKWDSKFTFFGLSNGSLDDPKFSGTDGIMEAYENILDTKPVNPQGKNKLEPLLAHLIDSKVRPTKNQSVFHVIIVYTKNDLNDKKAIRRLLIETSKLPYCVIFVPLGERIIVRYINNQRHVFYKFDDIEELCGWDLHHFHLVDGIKLMQDKKCALREMTDLVAFNEYKDNELGARYVFESVPPKICDYFYRFLN